MTTGLYILGRCVRGGAPRESTTTTTTPTDRPADRRGIHAAVYANSSGRTVVPASSAMAMMVVTFVRIVVCCVLAVAVFCGTAGRAAPTVSYDQRQNGEYNLQVDMEDVAIVLLPGGGDDFAQRTAMFGGGKLAHQVFGRRAGNSKKKHKKPVANCTATATATTTSNPEVPSSSPAITTTTEEYEEVASSGQEKYQEETYVLHPVVHHVHQTGAVQNPKTDDVPDPDRPPAVTPGNVVASSTANAEQMVAVKIVEKPTATGTIPAAGEAIIASGGPAEMVAVKTVEKSTQPTYRPSVDVTGDANVDGGSVVNKPTEKSVATTFDERPVVSVGSSAADEKTGTKTADGETAVNTGGMGTESPKVAVDAADPKVDTTVVPTRTVEEHVAESVEKVADHPVAVNVTDGADGTRTIPKNADEPIEMVAMKTVEKPTAPAAEQPEKSAADVAVNTQAENAKEQTADGPVEMVAMKTVEKPTVAEKTVEKPTVAGKTVEKPTFSEALKSPKTPVDSDGPVKNHVVVTEASITATVDLNRKPAQEMVAMKTVEHPASGAGTMEKSGVSTGTKPLEVHQQVDFDKNVTPIPIADEAIVSRSAPKVTEMVAVKTMENPATTTSVKTVVSVKTMMKPGIPKTAMSSNGSTIMRKVGDRKPSPSVTLGVAPPKVV